MNFLALVRKEVKELLRTYRLLIVVAVLGALGLFSPALAYLAPELVARIGPQFQGLVPPPTASDALAQYQKNLVQFGALLAIILGMGSVAQEKESGTAGMLLTKPVSRLEFLLAKLLAQWGAFFLALAVAGIGCYLYTWLLFEPLAVWPFLALNLLIASFLAFYVALSLAASALAPST
ncbi:MAG: ABC transporter permease, partial [Chloroflexota bacterium]|nr:ABC transporter permease [Chloroflexota bacterium]